jgi:hypothetical protein
MQIEQDRNIGDSQDQSTLLEVIAQGTAAHGPSPGVRAALPDMDEEAMAALEKSHGSLSLEAWSGELSLKLTKSRVDNIPWR